MHVLYSVLQQFKQNISLFAFINFFLRQGL